MHSIRYSLLNFLQDYKVRVSIFLNENKQKTDGAFKFGPPVRMIKSKVDPRSASTVSTHATCHAGVRYPGAIRYFDANGEVVAEDGFPPGMTYSPPVPQGGLGLNETGNRGTAFGLNM
jgi:hypothetical protein